MTPSDPLKKRTRQILKVLAELYPDAHCALNYRNPLELLVATILSAQCTDVRVNLVTPELFRRYPNAAAYAAADPIELETAIQSTGFFRNKARSIKACCRALVDHHGGEVPDTMEQLVPLAGVGRKTANVILGNAFGVPGITVDTHVGRLSRRLGLTEVDDPVKVESALMELIPKKDWTMFSHRMIFHGRQVCHARQAIVRRLRISRTVSQGGFERFGVTGTALVQHVGTARHHPPLVAAIILPVSFGIVACREAKRR